MDLFCPVHTGYVWFTSIQIKFMLVRSYSSSNFQIIFVRLGWFRLCYSFTGYCLVLILNYRFSPVHEKLELYRKLTHIIIFMTTMPTNLSKTHGPHATTRFITNAVSIGPLYYLLAPVMEFFGQLLTYEN